MSGKLTLVIMSRDGAVAPVPIQGNQHELFIGRDPGCDAVVPGVNVSRKHARLTHDPATGTVQITDLGSRNGTTLDGQRLEALRPVPFVEGSIVRVGDAVLALERRGSRVMPQRVPWGEAFALRVDAEIARAAAEGETLALVEVRLDGAAGGDGLGTSTTVEPTVEGRELGAALEAEGALAGAFRETDVLASFTDGVWRALLPRTSPEQARQLVKKLRILLEGVKRNPVMRLSTYPRHGGTSEALVRALADVGDDPLESLRQPVRAAGPMAGLGSMIERVASSAANVLLVGETGVGKEVLAHAIHERSPRAGKPLVCINCAAIPENLIESELFGYEKNTHSTAFQAKPGLLESAADGTVLFDEIGEMPLLMQAKLLRAIEAREVLRIGGVKPRPIQARFLFATHRDLEKEVEAGRFRQDLYFRIHTIAINIPPLRERKGEIASLAATFVGHACEASRRPDPPRLSQQVLELFERYSWPGNVRELRNVIERAVVLCDGPLITLEHLPLERFKARPPKHPAQPGEGTADDPNDSGIRRGPGGANGANGARAAPPPPFDADSPELPDLSGFSQEEREECKRIVDALKQCAGNQSTAAKMLDMSRRTFVSRLTKYNLPRPRKSLPGGARLARGREVWQGLVAMRVVQLENAFGLDNLALRERAPKAPGPGQVRLRMRAASLNYRDLMMVEGRYNPRQPLPLVPCSDGVGEVVEAGPGASRFAPGRRVMPTFSQRWLAGDPYPDALASTLGGPLDGTLAEEMVVDEAGLVDAPAHLTDEQAATLPCAALTAWSALVTYGSVKAGDTVLVLGTGGVSVFAMQFAALLGAEVVVTSGSDEKLERARALGAKHFINYKKEPKWSKAVRAATGGRGVDLVVEVGGAGTFDESLRSVRPGGQVSLIGVLSGGETAVNLTRVLMQGVRVQGVFVGHRQGFEAMNRAVVAHKLEPVVDRAFELEDVRSAFEVMRAGGHFGKIVVRVGRG